MSQPTSTRPAGGIGDWIQSLGAWRLWTALGREDLVERYRRSVFGLSWVAASFAGFVYVKIAVFGQMTTASQAEFALFVTLGFGLWSLINGVAVEACMAYTNSVGWIKGTAVPYPVFILQVVYRNWLVFSLILVVMVIVLIWTKVSWSPVAWMALPGLAIHIVSSLWITLLLATLCARWRDVQHFVQTVMRLLFFVTPILWVPSQTPQLAVIAEMNPLTHFIEIVRAPLIYGTVPVDSWIAVLAINAVGIPVAAAVYVVSRKRLVYWL